MKTHWLTLRFPEPDRERAFQAHYEQRFGWMMRLAIIVAIAFYALFGILDAVLYPEQRYQLWFVRYVIVIPVLLLVAVYLFRARQGRWSQPMVSLGSIVGGMGIVAMTIIIPPEYTNIYFAGLMLVAMFSFTVFRLQFVWANTVGWLTVLAYNLAMWIFDEPPPGELLTANFFYVTANLMGMVACYEMEYDARYSFVLQEELREEQRRLDALNHQLDAMAHQDELTGLANRRHFFEHFHQEWNRHLRFGAPLSLLIIDVDYFKNYNDSYGHQAGDDCLRRIADTLTHTARRAGDFVARLGGEEFVVLLARTDAEDACMLGEKLRWQIEQAGMAHAASRVADVVTISVGAATTVPVPDNRIEDLLRCADEALYAAKANGRNQVICQTLPVSSEIPTEAAETQDRSDTA